MLLRRPHHLPIFLIQSLSLMLSIISFSLLSGCGLVKSKAKDLEDSIFAEPEYKPVPGEEAFKFFQVVPGAGPIDAKAQAATMSITSKEASQEQLGLLGLVGEDKSEVPEVDSTTVDFMTSNAATKATLDSSKFKIPDPNKLKIKATQGTKLSLIANKWDGLDQKSLPYSPKGDKVDLSDGAWGGKSEIIISNLNRLPIKNQGNRSTCASFTGVSAIEYLVLKKYGSDITGIDLSEQRFYMLSRSELWDKGGGTVDADGGSAWQDGYQMSYGDDGKTPPTDQSPYNIPLESDCPYSPDGGANELQIPQASTCKRGVIKVKNLTRTFNLNWSDGTKELRSNSVRSAQEIFDYIKKYDLPIPVGTTLTENWQNNDGMITVAKSKTPGYGPHAGGHAYLIVGMRKLNEADFPGEGGMCFVIRNSWGTGWGVGGLSCMTLAWFNEYRDESSYDVTTDVDVDLAYLKSKSQVGTGTLPAPAGPVTPTPPTPEPAPAIVTKPDPGPPPVTLPTPGPAGDSVPPTPPAVATGDGFTLARLVTKDNQLVQVQYKISGSQFMIKGVNQGGTSVSLPLELVIQGQSLKYTDELRGKKEIIAGEIQGDLIYLCSGKYALTCVLNYLKESNNLVIGVAEQEFRRYDADPDASYTTLFNLANYGVEYHKAEGVYTDIRLIIKGQTTNPLRLAVKPIGGEILMYGREIGNYQKAALCSGDYKKVCRLIYDRKNNKIQIFFKAKSA